MDIIVWWHDKKKEIKKSTLNERIKFRKIYLSMLFALSGKPTTFIIQRALTSILPINIK